MATQPTDFMNEGATGLSAGNWEGSGFVANAKLCTSRGASDVAGSDQSANAIDFWWIIAPFAGNIGSASTPAIFTIDDTYTTDANFVYAPSGGIMYADIRSSLGDIPEMQVGGSGTLFVTNTSSAITTLYVTGGVTRFGSSAEYTTLEMSGGEFHLEDNSGTNPTTNTITGGIFYTERGSTTLNIDGESARVVLAGDGENYGTVNARRGNVSWLYGDAGTVTVRRGATIDFSKLKDAVTITSLRIFSGGTVIDLNNPLLSATVTYPDTIGGGGIVTGGGSGS